MIEKLSVKNFRGLTNLDLSLAPFTLIGGANNVGKTSVLEAVFMLYGYRGLVFQQLNSFRSATAQPAYNVRELWENLFYNYDVSQKITLSATRDGNQESLTLSRDENIDFKNEKFNLPNGVVLPALASSAHLSYPLEILYKFGKKENHFYVVATADGNVSNLFTKGDERNENIGNIPNVTFFNDRLINRAVLYEILGKISREKKKDKVVDVIKCVDNRIQDFVLGEKQEIYLDIAGTSEMIPLTYMGMGITNILYWVANAISGSAEILLIDEIENGIHYSSMPDIMKQLCEIGRRIDCQIIATTHSVDCVWAFSLCPENRTNYIRLERDTRNGNIVPVAVDTKHLSEMLESDWEVR